MQHKVQAHEHTTDHSADSGIIMSSAMHPNDGSAATTAYTSIDTAVNVYPAAPPQPTAPQYTYGSGAFNQPHSEYERDVRAGAR